MKIETLREDDSKSTSLVPCDNCGKGWPIESQIYVDVPAGKIVRLCSWQCMAEYSKKQYVEIKC